MKDTQPLRVALVYDRVNSWGGAERVLLELHQAFPQAPLFTSVFDVQKARWAKDWPVIPSWLQNMPSFLRHHRLWGWLMPLVFETTDLSACDVIISVTSEAAKAVITQPNQLHICYLLTPTRYLWSHQNEYLDSLWWWLRPFAREYMRWLKKWDRVAAQRPDVLVAISERVKDRIEHFYARKCDEVLYPPITTLPKGTAPAWKPPTGKPWMFLWGRHVAYKRFDLAIEAGLQRGWNVVVAGEGPATKMWQQKTQKHQSKDASCKWLGVISDEELSWYLERATCAVFPAQEDFGIAPLEAQSMGCPVVIHQDSGAAELMTEETAVFIKKISLATIVKALDIVDRTPWDRLDIRRRTRHHAGVEFQHHWQMLVAKYWKQHRAH